MDKDFLTGLGISDEACEAVLSEHKSSVDSLRLNFEIEKEMSRRGAKSIDAAMKLFDKEGLNLENSEEFVKRIDSFENENGFLFEKNNKKPVFSKQMHPDDGITKEEFDKMGYEKRLKIFNENPEMYNRLK